MANLRSEAIGDPAPDEDTRPAASPPSRPRGRRSREQIVTAACGLVDAHGARSSAVTARSIASAAGVSTGALYHHFKDIDRILAAAVERYAREMVAMIDSVYEGTSWSDWGDMLNSIISAFADYFGRHWGLSQLWFDDHASADVLNVHRHYRNRMAEDARHHFLLVTGQDLPIITHQIAIALSSSLFEFAFRASPAGEPVVIAELREVVHAYYARHLNSPARPDESGLLWGGNALPGRRDP